MVRLLLVDNSPQNLEVYKALFIGKEEQWNCQFADSIKDVFDKLSNADFDIIVADVKMPVLNGIPLLETVAQMYPNIIRVVLVPALSADYPKHFVKFAHRIVVRPVSGEKLETLIIRIHRLYKTIMHPQGMRFIDGLEKIPSLPKVYGDLVAELESPSPSVKKAGFIIAKDIGMSAAILKMVNSAYFGLDKRVTSPELAVSLLGLDIVQGLVLTAHLFSAFSNAETKLLNLEVIVDHCLIVGSFAKDIAIYENLPSNVIDSLHIAGILHDIGRLIFASHSPKLYRNIMEIAAQENRPLYEVEQELLGIMHAEVGAYLLGLWGLPELVIELIAYHHSEEIPEFLAVELSILKAADVYSKNIHSTNSLDSSESSDNTLSTIPIFREKKEKWYNVCIESFRKSAENNI
ncbi:MAG: HDOD domain-containing protein [Chitinispirillales bacterium]|jgi:HD-like signal output (HDOD) protein|nr:HDOD domain-containing protein [Chitinispirillales bacterium]